MACPSDPRSTSSAVERSTSATVHQVSILRPKKRVIEHPPPQLHFEAKLLSLDSDVTPLTSGNSKDQAAESEGSDWV